MHIHIHTYIFILITLVSVTTPAIESMLSVSLLPPVILALVTIVVQCRHRGDIFRDDLTLSQALDQAKRSYSPKEILDDRHHSFLDRAAFAIFDKAASAFNFANAVATLAPCTPTGNPLSTPVKVLRQNCPADFETVAKEVTEVLKATAQEKLAGDQDGLKAYTSAVELQERVTEYVPLLPAWTPYQFGTIVVAVIGVAGLVLFAKFCC